jgi:chorismate mutase
MYCRGIRGATTVESNTRDDILAAARELVQEMVEANGVEPDDIACIIFSTTPDLNAEFPAAAVAEMGWSVPRLCTHEMDVPGALHKCLRVLMMCNTEKKAGEITHIYTRGATELRNRGAGPPPAGGER